MGHKIALLCCFVFAALMTASLMVVIAGFTEMPSATASSDAAGLKTDASDSCYDSDGGNYSGYFIKGSVSGILNGHEYKFTDSCMTNSVENDSLEEWLCVGTSPEALMYVPCSLGCIDGACILNYTITTTTTTPPVSTPASCIDTDGLDAYTKGTITGWFGMHSENYTYTDTCVNSTAVREYFCRYATGFEESMVIDCADGYYCSDGRCTASNGTAQCVMPGNNYPCDQVTLQEVMDSITKWISGNISLGDVIKLIVSWMDPAGHVPD